MFGVALACVTVSVVYPLRDCTVIGGEMSTSPMPLVGVWHPLPLINVKGVYSSLSETYRELRSVTCHVGSYSVACH